MLDDTLVIWGGEFGRTPMSQGGDGRDHHIKGFSFMLAGGGIKGGITYGATDDLGYAAVENPVSVHDFHATMLHLLGIDHKADGEVSGSGRGATRSRSRDASGRTTWASGLSEEVMRALRRPAEDRDAVETHRAPRLLDLLESGSCGSVSRRTAPGDRAWPARLVDSIGRDDGVDRADADAHPAARQLDGRFGAHR